MAVLDRLLCFLSRKKFFLGVFLCFATGFLWAEKEAYEVRLAMQADSLKLAVVKTRTREPKWEAAYLARLEDVLVFDLKNAGYFQLSDLKKETALLTSGGFDLSYLKSLQVAFAARLEVEQDGLFLNFFEVYKNRSQRLGAFKLKGQLSHDRRLVHRLADLFLEKALGRKGIFQSRLLYSVRIEKGGNGAEKDGKGWLSEIWICDWDGENRRQLTFEKSYCLHPLFLSQEEFLYVSYRSGFPKIYRSRFETGLSRPLISLRGNQLLPALSSDRQQLAFISDVAGRPDLFLQPLNVFRQAEAKPVQLFSFPRATQASSSFSPDGKKLVFVSDKDGTPRLYLINLEENAEQRRPKAELVTLKNRDNVSPSFSLDGKKIAYSAKTAAVRQIWLYDLETKEEKQLTFDCKNKENPYFASDNLHLVYNTEDRAEAELYLLNVNDPKPMKIGGGAGRKRFPAFEQN
ncbi:MAG: hypothetical protein WC371_03735 [Parachlamydiales bacterium]|jgi:TolB protein